MLLEHALWTNVIILPHSGVWYFYTKYCNVVVTPCWSCTSCNMWMIRGSLRTPDRLFELFGSHVQQSGVLRTMTGACGPYNLGGSATAGIRAHTWIRYNITFENFKRNLQIKSFWRVTNWKWSLTSLMLAVEASYRLSDDSSGMRQKGFQLFLSELGGESSFSNNVLQSVFSTSRLMQWR